MAYKKPTKQQLEAFFTEYYDDARTSTAELARKHGISLNTVNYVLAKHAKLPPRNQHLLNKINRAQFEVEWKSGEQTVAQLAAKYKIHLNTLQTFAKECGLPSRRGLMGDTDLDFDKILGNAVSDAKPEEAIPPETSASGVVVRLSQYQWRELLCAAQKGVLIARAQGEDVGVECRDAIAYAREQINICAAA